MRAKRPRDSQRGKYWKAIWELKPETSHPLADIKAVQKFVNRCLKLKRFQKTFPHMTGKKVYAYKEGSTATYDSESICAPKWCWNQHQVLLLLAYVVNRHGKVKWDNWHGREAMRTWVALVGLCIGRDEERRLKASLKKHGVKHTKKRPLSKGLAAHNAAVKELLEAAKAVNIQQESTP